MQLEAAHSVAPINLHAETVESAAETLVAHFNADDNNDDGGDNAEQDASEWGLDGVVAVDEGPRGESIFDEATAAFEEECSGDEDEKEDSVRLSPCSDDNAEANDEANPPLENQDAAAAHTSPALLSLDAFLGGSSSSLRNAASPFEAPPVHSAPHSPDLAEACARPLTEAPNLTSEAVTLAEASMASVELGDGPLLFGGHENDDELSTVHACSLASAQDPAHGTTPEVDAAPETASQSPAAAEATTTAPPQEGVDLAAVAALEEIVGDLLAQKLSWCEQSAAHDEAAQLALKRCATAEIELAASAETVALLEAQAEQDANLIQDLQDRCVLFYSKGYQMLLKFDFSLSSRFFQFNYSNELHRVSSTEKALEAANKRAVDASCAEQNHLMHTIHRQKAELDTLLEAAATKDLNLASLEV